MIDRDWRLTRTIFGCLTIVLLMSGTLTWAVQGQDEPPETPAKKASGSTVYIYRHNGGAFTSAGIDRVRRRIAAITTYRDARHAVYPIMIYFPQVPESDDSSSGSAVTTTTELAQRTERQGAAVDERSDDLGESAAVPEEPSTERGATMEQVEKMLLETGLFATTDVNFEFDESSLLPSSERILDTVGEVLLRHSELHIEVAGHTDNIGDRSYNQALSERRANAARSYLLAVTGIETSRIAACGHGEMQPVASNASVTGRALNRRVEFRVLDGVGPGPNC